MAHNRTGAHTRTEILFFSKITINFIILIKDASDCDTEYGCFKQPQNCQNTDCNYLIKWKRQGDMIDFLMYTQTQDNTWLAIGFNQAPKMVYLNK